MDLNVIIDIIGLILVSVVLFASIRGKTPKNTEEKLFFALMICVIFIFVIDIIGLLLDGMQFKGSRILLYFFDTLYWLPHTIYCILWLIFVDFRTFRAKPRLRFRIPLYVLPMIAEWVIIFLNLKTGWLFTLDEANRYTIGTKYQLCLIPFYAYIIGTLGIAVYGYFSVKDSEQKRLSLALLVYMFLPLCGVLLEIFAYGVSWVWPFIALSLLMVYLSLLQKTENENKLKMMQLDTALTKSRISVMLSQIQPHFLFNALTVIQDLCHVNPQEAEKTVVMFSQFLRGNLDSLTSDKPISFENELNHTINYLSIEQRRFKRLKVEYDIRAKDFRVPALTLQPIVENAVRYGVTKKEEGGTVKITSEETKEAFIVTVSDDGVGFDATLFNDVNGINVLVNNDEKSHIGIANVKSRLQSMCGGDLKISTEKGIGTTVTITVTKGEHA